jgi:hypothetical protein
MRLAFIMLLTAAPVLAKPQIKDIQAAHGQLGPERKSLDCFRGDELYFRFTVADFTTNDDGRLAGELAFTVSESTGKQILKKEIPLQQTLALGGGAFPAHVAFTIGEELPVGDYTIKVTVTDNLARESDSFERKFKCKDLEFALVAVRFYQDADGRVPATVGGIVSQTLFLKARGVGFDKSKGEIDVEMTIEVLDPKGKPVLAKPIRSMVHNEDANVVKSATVINLRGELALNRAGEFVLKISLIDKIAKKTATFESPLKVIQP